MGSRPAIDGNAALTIAIIALGIVVFPGAAFATRRFNG